MEEKILNARKNGMAVLPVSYTHLGCAERGKRVCFHKNKRTFFNF